ncbi:DUF6531 domain-containing protein, partial [Sporosalibacterium faouarense]|uniref:DUF6531 domain-containing protein n=1 Tax=Sporosalibacterium faouarense TaxID=516123 RepID=UPI00192BBD76
MLNKINFKNMFYKIIFFISMLLIFLTVNTCYDTVFADSNSKSISDTDTKSSNNFVQEKAYDDGEYEGVLQLYSVVNLTRTEYRTEHKTFKKSASNTITRYYNEDGSFDHHTENWNGPSDHNNYPINQDGYSGTIPRVGTSDSGERIVSTWPDGTKKKSKITYTAKYEGELSKQVPYTVYEYKGKYKGHAYKKEVVLSNYGDPSNVEFVNEPVNIITGNYYAVSTDLTIPEIGQDLKIQRYYNSLDKRNSIIGKGWRLNYDTSLSKNGSSNDITIIYPSGKTIIFEKDAGSDTYDSPEAVFDTLIQNSDNTYTLELQNKLKYKYNSSGKLIAIIDKNDNTVNISYDGYGNIDVVTGEGGKTLSFTFVAGKLKTITDDINRTITYNYDSSNNLKEVIDTGDNTTIYSYNSYGITDIRDGNNKKFIENVYDKFSRVIRQYDEEGNEIRYDYDDINRQNTYTFTATGKSIKYNYNDTLYVTKKIYNDGTYEQYTYDQWGNKDSIRDRNGNTTNYLYNARGDLLELTSPSPFSYETIFEYDENNNIEKITNPSGATTTYTYNENENLEESIVSINETTNGITSYTYDDKGRVLTITDPENNVTTLEYENHKDPVRITDPEGNEVSYTYDGVGRKKTITTSYGTTTLYYNDLDKIIKIVDADGNTTRMKYDGQGNLIKLINPEQYNESVDDGVGTTYEYDAMDRLLKTIDPLGNVLAQKYDAEGNVVKEINPNYYNSSTDDGIGNGYEYDKSGRLIRVENPSGEKSRIVYDGVGNPIKVIDANNYNESTDSGNGLEYEFNSLNRLTKIIDTEGNVIKKLVYDEDGNIIKEIDGKGYMSGSDDDSRYGTLYKYNLAGWLLEKRIPVKKESGEIYYNLTRYTYDKAGRVLEEKKSPEYVTIDSEPSKWNIINYLYYKNGLVKTVIDSTGAYIEYSYDELGNTTLEKSKIDDDKYSVKGYHYDNLGRLDREWTEIDGTDLRDGEEGIVLAETLYQYDKNGNIIKITSPEGYITEFKYDDGNRLTEKIEEVPEDYIDVKGTTASVTSDRRIIYPSEEYEYEVKINPDGEVTSLDINIEYDTRLFEIVEITPEVEGITVNTHTGEIEIDASSSDLTNETTIATITIKAKDTVKGTGYIKINSSSTYTDGNSNKYKFIEANGKTAIINEPDMNNDNSVETDDFTLTAILKDIERSSLKYNEKFDIDGSNIIDTPDLDYIKDWLFEEKSNDVSLVEAEKFYEKHITPVYTTSSSTVTRTTTYDYDNAGNLITETDCYNNTIEYEYDEYNRLISVTDKEGSTSKVFYDEVGNIVKEISPENYNSSTEDGPGTVYEYDSMNRLVKVTDSKGNVVQKNIYDINGLKIKEIDAKGYLSASNDDNRYGTEYTYDIGNRVIRIKTPESITVGKAKVEYSYDSLGNILTYTDGEDNTTTYERDLWGRATKIIDGEGIENTYEYDYAGNVVSSTDGENNTTTYTYNRMNLLSSITDPLNQTITYKYDKEGRLRLETYRNGESILYDYNRDDNLVSKTIADKNLEEKYLYNRDGSLLAAINSSGIETFEYSPNGYLKNKYRNERNILGYDYDKDGNITDVTDQTGATTSYTYDILGRIDTVLDGSQEIAEYNYNIDSTISSISYNTGVNISYGYDLDKNIESLVSKNPQGNIIKELEYSYYNNGNIKTKVENGQTTIYTYDKADRLKTENNPIAGLITYNYDDAHNILKKQVGDEITTYSYDDNNRLLESITNGVTTTYDYDNNGNLLETTKGEEITSYIYNEFNQLKEVNKSDGTWMYNEYSPLGLRVATEENGIYNGFTFDRQNIITEVDSNNDL